MESSALRYRVMAAGLMCVLLTIGIGRFAYTPLLPVMQEQTGLGLSRAGWLAAVIYMGYLVGAILASQITSLRAKDRFYRIALILGVISTLGMALSDNFWLWVFFRFLAGLSGTAGMIISAALILHWLVQHGFRGELGIHYGGVGLGVVIVTLVIESMSTYFDWREQWLGLTLLSVVLAVLAWVWLPPPDTEKPVAKHQTQDHPPSPLFFKLFLAAYCCAGVGYVVSVTFIVAIIDGLPGMEGKGGLGFLVMGLAAAIGAFLWDRVARSFGYFASLSAAALLQIAGILLPVMMPSLPFVLLGCVLFGATFIGLVSLVLTMSGHYFPTRPAKMMGKMSVAYGVAQIVGPAVTGIIAEYTGNYNAGLYMAALVMVIGLCLFIFLKFLDTKEDRQIDEIAAYSAR